MKKKVLTIIFLLLSPVMVIITFMLFTDKYMNLEAFKVIDSESIRIYKISSIEKELDLYPQNFVISIEDESYQISVKNVFLWQYISLFTFYLLIICIICNIITYIMFRKFSMRNFPKNTWNTAYDNRGNAVWVNSEALTEYYTYDHNNSITKLERRLKDPTLRQQIAGVWGGEPEPQSIEFSIHTPTPDW